MNVLLVVTKSELGGAQYFVLSLAQALKQQGVNVAVAAGDGDFLQTELSGSNIPFHYLASLKRDANFLSSLKYCFELIELIKQYKYSVVHFNSTNTLTAVLPMRLMRNRPKLVYTMHGLSLLDKDSKTSLLLRVAFYLYLRTLLPFLDTCVFVSEKNRAEARRIGIITSGKVILNGLFENPDLYLSQEFARRYLEQHYQCKLDTSFILGSVGRLAYPKNFEFLIENFYNILKIIPNAMLIIIGDGPLEKKYRDLIVSLKLTDKILLTGAIPNASKLIKAFNIFVLPSHFEGLSISLLEALFANVPILAADVGGNSEILGNHSEYLYKSDCLPEFIAKIEGLHNGKAIYNAHFSEQREKFSGMRMVEEYSKVYKKLY